MASQRRPRESFAERRARRAEVDDPAIVLEAALRFLEARQRSVAEVRRRLTTAGYREELITAALERLGELGVLDDGAFASLWVESRDRARPRGERALRQELRQKGIDSETIAATLEARNVGADADASEADGDRQSADESAAERLARSARPRPRSDRRSAGPAPARVRAAGPERLRAGGRRAPCQSRCGSDGRRHRARPARLRRPRPDEAPAENPMGALSTGSGSRADHARAVVKPRLADSRMQPMASNPGAAAQSQNPAPGAEPFQGERERRQGEAEAEERPRPCRCRTARPLEHEADHDGRVGQPGQRDDGPARVERAGARRRCIRARWRETRTRRRR